MFYEQVDTNMNTTHQAVCKLCAPVPEPKLTVWGSSSTAWSYKDSSTWFHVPNKDCESMKMVRREEKSSHSLVSEHINSYTPILQILNDLKQPLCVSYMMFLIWESNDLWAREREAGDWCSRRKDPFQVLSLELQNPAVNSEGWDLSLFQRGSFPLRDTPLPLNADEARTRSAWEVRRDEYQPCPPSWNEAVDRKQEHRVVTKAKRVGIPVD